MKRLATRCGEVCGLALLLLAPAAASSEIDLIGTWHVLVHYTDDNTPHPDEMRWSDRIWVFEKKGSGLRWTEYPIVVFGDESGRFERRSTGQYARVIGAWEPSESQLANIEAGLKINTRGSKNKSLRGSDEEGWHTTSRRRAASASVITYQENWSIEGLPELPVFVQADVMGSGRSETMEGVARYETTAVEEVGDVLVGRYERDGTRHGSFRMRRSGEVGRLEGKSQSEIQAQGFRRGLETNRELRKQARESLEEVLRSNGVQLADEQMDEVVTQAIRLYLSGASEEQVAGEIRRLVEERMETSPQLRKQARESLEEALASSGVQLADEQKEELVMQAIRLSLSGASEEQVAGEIRKSIQEMQSAEREP